MISEIINILQKQMLENKELYDRYKNKESLNNKKASLRKEISVLNRVKEELEEEKKSYSFFGRFFNRDYKETKKELDETTITIREKESSVLELEKQINSINFSTEEEQIIELCRLIDNLTIAYNKNNTRELVEGLIQYFETDFNKLISFCKANGILLDFSGETEFAFIDSFNFQRQNYAYKNGLSLKKYSKLEDLILVRKVTTIPEDDKLVPAYKNFFREDEKKIIYDGVEYHINTTIPAGHTTLHFMLNQEVLPHKDAPQGWSHCNIIIMQPLNDKLYNQAVGLNPVDIVFESTVELENYLIICDSQEKAKEIMQKNKNATVFVFSNEHINGSGNRVLCCLDYRVLYRDYNGADLDWNYPYKECYDETFLEKYPRLVTDLVRGPSNAMHNFYNSIAHLYADSQVLDYVLSLAQKEENLEEALRKIFETITLGQSDLSCGIIWFSECKRTNIKLSSLLDSQHQSFSTFLDEIIAMNEYNLDPQLIFERLIEGVEITEENRAAFLKLKEIVIKEVTAFVPDTYKLDVYNKFVYKLFALRKIVVSSLVNKKINSKPSIADMMEHVDFSNLEDYSNSIVSVGLNENKSLGECMKLCNRELASSFGEFKLTRPQDNFTNNFIKQLERIRKLERKEKLREIVVLIDSYNFPDESSKNLFESFVDDYVFYDVADERISSLAIALIILKYYNPDLVKQDNVGLAK